MTDNTIIVQKNILEKKTLENQMINKGFFCGAFYLLPSFSILQVYKESAISFLNNSERNQFA